jgi:hypothetical protein
LKIVKISKNSPNILFQHKERKVSEKPRPKIIIPAVDVNIYNKAFEPLRFEKGKDQSSIFGHNF